MPAADTLPDGMERSALGGVSVGKGPVAAFSTAPAPGETGAGGRDMVEALPSLRAAGLPDVLAPRGSRPAARPADPAPGPPA